MSSWISASSDVAYLSVWMYAICYSVICPSRTRVVAGISLSDYLCVCKCVYAGAQRSDDMSRPDLEVEDYTEANWQLRVVVLLERRDKQTHGMIARLGHYITASKEQEQSATSK